MIGIEEDSFIDKVSTLRRLKDEVSYLAENLVALTYHPDEYEKNGTKRIDGTTELYMSFWHEPEPVEPEPPLS